MSESLQYRIKRALATEGLELGETSEQPHFTSTGLVVSIREKRRDRGRDMAEKVVLELNNSLLFKEFSRDVGQVMSANIPIDNRVTWTRKYVAAAINASNAELIREVLAILDQFHNDPLLRFENLRAAIAALSPETP